MTSDHHRTVLERIKVALRVSNDLRGFADRLDYNVALSSCDPDDLVHELRTFIHGLADQEINVHEWYPRDWWEAFKERWFPQWLANRFPVRYKHIRINEKRFKAVCPYLPDAGSDPKPYLEWLHKQDVQDTPNFRRALRSLLNQYPKENESDTPDYALAGYLERCLQAYNFACRKRDSWHAGHATYIPPSNEELAS